MATVERRALVAIAGQFFVNGALFASFVPRLPEIRDEIGITIDRLGLLMSLAAAGGLLTSAVVGFAIDKVTSRKVLILGGVIMSVSLLVIGFAQTAAIFLVGLIGVFSFDVFVDVAMNLQGSALSGQRAVPVMNRLHGLWSLGTVVGGFAASRLAAAGVPLDVHLTIMAFGLLTIGAVLWRWLLVGAVRPGAETAVAEGLAASRSPGSGETTAPVVGLVLLGLAGLFAVTIESTSIDWAAFRFADDFSLSAGSAAVGYVAVTAGMTCGRFGGDWFVARIGPRRLILLSGLVVAAGLVAATLIAAPLVSILGFAFVGLGVSTMLPTVYDRAANHPGRSGAGLGALTGGLRIATLVVPLSVGVLAQSRLAVGTAIAIVTIPSVVGYLFAVTRLSRNSRSWNAPTR